MLVTLFRKTNDASINKSEINENIIIFKKTDYFTQSNTKTL